MFNKIKKWLEQMAERNEQRYGGQRLDCCGLNHQHNHERHRERKPALVQKR